jgi:hypothetical protein
MRKELRGEAVLGEEGPTSSSASSSLSSSRLFLVKSCARWIEESSRLSEWTLLNTGFSS